MIFLTGDTHGSTDIHKLSSDRWLIGKTLNKSDYLIVLGDFGLIWNNDKTDEYWKGWLTSKPWTTLFIDGNHDNHELLSLLPTKQKFGNEVGVVTESIFYLKRGRVYYINNNSFFCMGGAKSIDKNLRTEHISWWKEEIPSFEEFERGLESLSKNKIDYILTHTAPEKAARELLIQSSFSIAMAKSEKLDCVTKYLQQIKDTIPFKHWYCGHWHDNKIIDNIHFLYEDIISLDKETS